MSSLDSTVVADVKSIFGKANLGVTDVGDNPSFGNFKEKESAFLCG
jgi:hypothetical protein